MEFPILYLIRYHNNSLNKNRRCSRDIFIFNHSGNIQFNLYQAGNKSAYRRLDHGNNCID